MDAGYVDLQVNGYVGVDFNDPNCDLGQLRHAAQHMRDDGVSFALPTVITASLAAMQTCIGNLASAMETDPIVASVFKGIHVEGPFLSKTRGFIGAHPPEHAAEADLQLLDALLQSGAW